MKSYRAEPTWQQDQAAEEKALEVSEAERSYEVWVVIVHRCDPCLGIKLPCHCLAISCLSLYGPQFRR
ncbi:hypothetical protein ACOMHN_029182 [Nucella lapillus]